MHDRRFVTSVFGILAVALGLSLSARAQSTSAGDPAVRRLLIRNVTVISLEREAPFGPVDVSIRDGRIAEVAENLPTNGLEAGQMLDATGKFLLPGLIDSHVHLSMVPGMHGGHEAQFPGIAKAAREQIPRSFLYHGFTSVVDLISNASFAKSWNARGARPHLYFSGAAPMLDGYPTQFLPAPIRYHVFPHFLFDPARAAAMPPGIEPQDHTPEAVVGHIAADGALAVKTFWEDGFGSANNLPVPPPDMLAALVVAAHARGLPVIAHANSETAQAACIAAGVDGLAHGLWTWDSPDAPELTAPIKAVLDAIVARGVAWQPTIQVLYGERDLFNPQFLSRPDVRAVVPRAVLEWYATPDGQWLAEDMRRLPHVTDLAAQGRWEEIDALPIRHALQALTYLHERGAKLLFGSDTPSAPNYANPAGLNGRLEMNHWIQAGVPPRDILYAATVRNAAFFNLKDELGTIEPGKRADLLLLAQDPTAGIEALDTIEIVIQEGRVFRREDLAAPRDGREK